MEKDKSILNLLDNLCKNFGAESLVYRDYWDGDLCAIGLSSHKKGCMLVYISTFGKDYGFYYCEVEEDGESKNSVGTVYQSENVSFAELVDVISKYLEVVEL